MKEKEIFETLRENPKIELIIDWKYNSSRKNKSHRIKGEFNKEKIIPLIISILKEKEDKEREAMKFDIDGFKKIISNQPKGAKGE